MARYDELWARIKQRGITAVRELVEERTVEQFFLDFKRSANNGSTVGLQSPDRNNLAKAISGFGNSEGGVLIWGIDCSAAPADGADVAHAELPLANAARFCAAIQAAVSGLTVPPHTSVESVSILLDDVRGFVATLIPASNHAPLQFLSEGRYYVRAGSSFVPAPHGVLAGMFGRRPQPHVFHNYLLGIPTFEGDALTAPIGVMLINDGPGVAQDIYAVVMVERDGGDASEIEFTPPEASFWTASFAFGVRFSMISAPGVRLPPGANSPALWMTLRLRPPFEKNLRLTGRAGASSAPPYYFVIDIPRERLAAVYAELGELSRAQPPRPTEMRDLLHRVLNEAGIDAQR